MSAAAVQTPAPLPLQASLAGIEPCPGVAEELEVRWSLVGRLERAAEARFSPDGRHGHLVLRLNQPAHGHRRRPAIVAHYHAHGEHVHDLHHLAAQLPAHSLVLCVCRGLDVEHEGEQSSRAAYLHAWRCDRIAPIAPHEAAHWLPDSALDSRVTTETSVP